MRRSSSCPVCSVATVVLLSLLPLGCGPLEAGAIDAGSGSVLTPGSGGTGGETGEETGLGNAPVVMSPADPNDTGEMGNNNQPVYAFVAVPSHVAARKAKVLLTGQSLDGNEASSVDADPNALRTLVRAWVKTDAYRAIMQDFFSTQFQQNQAQDADFAGQMYDRAQVGLTSSLLQAMRSSFGRTMVALNDQDASFAEAMTTKRLMMTSELMSYYAHVDSSFGRTGGNNSNRWGAKGTSLAIKMGYKSGPIDSRLSADPNSPYYLTFYLPELANAFSQLANVTVRAACAEDDPLNFTDVRTNGTANSWGTLMWMWARNRNFRYFQYPRDANGTYSTRICDGWFGNAGLYTAADANDWRMVTLRAPKSGERATEFFDMTTIRAANELLIAKTLHGGFFSTPAFLSQWGTNINNSMRGVANQTLIAALNEQIDGKDTLALSSPTAVDSAHASEPACFACHQTLDPLRQFFRKSYMLSYSPQDVSATAALPAQLSFRGATGTGQSIDDLGTLLANHPKLALAWTVKLCSWANSTPCLATDPEVIRIANVFSASGLKFNTLVEELFTSPLVTYSAETATTTQYGSQVSVARRSQLCALLSARLGVADICRLSSAQADGKNSVPSRAAILPSDSYSRGVLGGLYVTRPEPFYVANSENICALAAATAVDNGSKSWATSAAPDAAIDKMVATLMAVEPNARPVPTAVLKAHYQAALDVNQTATVALRSTFVAACNSGSVLTVGQ